jgi:hypothetical protein
MKRLILEKLNYVEANNSDQVKIKNKFAALKNLDNVNIKRTCESNRFGYRESTFSYELKHHKPCFDKE